MRDCDARITKQSSFLKQQDSFLQFRSEDAVRRKDRVLRLLNRIIIYIPNALHTIVQLLT